MLDADAWARVLRYWMTQVGIIMYLPTQDPELRRKITEGFTEYRCVRTTTPLQPSACTHRKQRGGLKEGQSSRLLRDEL